MHCIYVQTNFYKKPIGEVILVRACEKSEFPNCNTSGTWGTEKDGIYHQWFDLNIYNKLGI